MFMDSLTQSPAARKGREPPPPALAAQGCRSGWTVQPDSLWCCCFALAAGVHLSIRDHWPGHADDQSLFKSRNECLCTP